MDVDISDILAELEPSPYYSSSSADPSSASSSAAAALDHQQLTRFWISERACPDLLPWPSELMSRTMERVRAQIERIEDMTASAAADMSSFVSSSSREYGKGQTTTGIGGGGGVGGGVAPSNQTRNLVLSILQTDLSRTQYLVRSLLRQRLAKLTKFAVYYLTTATEGREDDGGGGGGGGGTKQQSSSSSSLLSPSEQSFLQHHQALLSRFYGASFLAALPAQLQRLDDNAGGGNMVEGPDGKTAVFVRCLAERWSADPGGGGGPHGDLDDDNDDDEEEGRAGAGAGAQLRMRRGGVWVVRWEDVRKGVLDGALELL